MASVYGNWNWRRAVAVSDLPSTTKLVLFTLSIHVPETGAGAFPSLAKLVAETSLTRKTVQTHLVNARDLGWISVETRFVESGRQTSNFYRLAVPGEGVGDTPSEGVGVTQGEGVANVPPVALKGPRRNGTKTSSIQRELIVGGEEPPAPTKATRDDFERLWLLGRRGSKAKAWQRYRAAVPKRISADAIFAAREAHVVGATDLRFVKGLDLWIRDDRWEEVVPDREPELPPEPGTAAWFDLEHERMLSRG